MNNESRRLRVGIVGLNFGSWFIESFQAHPDVAEVVICDMDAAKLAKFGDQFKINRRYKSLEKLLADKEVDAIHLNTAIPDHARQSMAVMASGKHCACAVPMATSLDDLSAIVAVADKTGLKYMMMATHAFTRQLRYVSELVSQGKLGQLQFLRGAHYRTWKTGLRIGWDCRQCIMPPMPWHHVSCWQNLAL